MTDGQKASVVDSLFAYLAGRTVNRIYVDYAFGIQFLEKKRKVEIRIEGEFTVQRDGKTFRAQATDTNSLAPVLTIFPRVLKTISMAEGDTLKLDFHEIILKVAPDPRYEAWEISTSDGAKIVCTPGGGLSMWGTRPDVDKPLGN